MKIVIDIQTGGDAFVDDRSVELERLIRKTIDTASNSLDALTSSGVIRDYNGNRCGTWILNNSPEEI